jgi:hypothetical protein
MIADEQTVYIMVMTQKVAKPYSRLRGWERVSFRPPTMQGDAAACGQAVDSMQCRRGFAPGMPNIIIVTAQQSSWILDVSFGSTVLERAKKHY